MLLRTTTFECTALVNAPADKVFATVAEPLNMVGLQPFLIRCDILKKEVSADLRTRAYDVYFIERFHLLGPIRYDNKIRVHIDIQSEPRQVHFHVKSFPRIRLRSSYVFEDQAGATLVRETVTVESPSLLASFVVKTARAAQERLLENLRRKLDGSRYQ